MDPKIKKQIKTGTAAELSELKASTAAGTGADRDEIVAAINDELANRASAVPDKVRIKAKHFVTVDGVPYQPGQEGEITAKQYAALAWNFAKVAACAALLCLGLASASAQQYNVQSVAITNGSTITFTGVSGTNCVIAANTTNTVQSLIPVTKYSDICIFAQFKLMSAGTTNVPIIFDSGVDGTNWVASTHTLWITAAGTTTVNGLTNIYVNAQGYLRLSTVGNGNTVALTNLLIEYVVKPRRTG